MARPRFGGGTVLDGFNYGRKTRLPYSSERLHQGLDFAGKVGSDVLAIADGVMIWPGWRSWGLPDAPRGRMSTWKF